MTQQYLMLPFHLFPPGDDLPSSSGLPIGDYDMDIDSEIWASTPVDLGISTAANTSFPLFAISGDNPSGPSIYDEVQVHIPCIWKVGQVNECMQ